MTTIIQGSDAGFFSMLRGTVGAMSHCHARGEDFYVNWRNTLYNDTDANCWTDFFEAPCGITKMSAINDDIKFQPHDPLPREYKTRLIMHEMIAKYVHPTEEIRDRHIEQRQQMVEHNNHRLGVHIRRTDKFNCTDHGEPVTGQPVTIGVYRRYIDDWLAKNDGYGFFLCTDDEEVANQTKNAYGSLVTTFDNIRSVGHQSIHHQVGNGLPSDKGKQALLDCMALASCEHIIKGISNLALFSMFINPLQTCTNLNSICHKDTREDFVCNSKDQ